MLQSCTKAVEEESDGISKCFWDDGQKYSTNEMFSLEVNTLFDTSPHPDIEWVMANDAGDQLWFSAIDTLNDMAANTFQSS